MKNTKKVAEGFPLTGAAGPPKRPPWLTELRAEFSALREEVHQLREEVRSLRGQRDPERNLSTDEAAEIAGISSRKLEELVHSGEVPSLKIGRRRLIPNRAFRAWLRSQAEGGAA